MPLGGSGINDEVLPFDPAMIAQAVPKHLPDCQVVRRGIKSADPARRPLRQRSPRRNEQRRSSRDELPPLHSILAQLEDNGTQSITSRLWQHSLRVQILHRKCRAWGKTAMGQTR